MCTCRSNHTSSETTGGAAASGQRAQLSQVLGRRSRKSPPSLGARGWLRRVASLTNCRLETRTSLARSLLEAVVG